MKAYVINGFGDYNVFELKEFQDREPGVGEIGIQIKAFSINDWDYGNMTGKPWFNKLILGTFKPKDVVLGIDLAGEVVKVGSQVTDFVVGDKVYGDMSESNFGAFADYKVVKAEAVRKMDKAMSFVQAAAIPQAGMLAYSALYDHQGIKNNMRILVNGAGGGVGSFVVQMAKRHTNIHITGVDSGEKLSFMKAMGYDEVIDYEKEDFTKNKQKYDLIIDNKMTRSIFKIVKSLAVGGRYATTGGYARHYFGVFVFSKPIKWLYKKHASLIVLKVNGNLEYFNRAFSEGWMSSHVDGDYAFDDFKIAMQHYCENKHKGKLVIKV